MNPMMMGGLAATAWSNPDLFSSAMAAQGVGPPGTNAVANPLVPPTMDQGDPLAAFMTPSLQAQGQAPMGLGGPDPAALAQVAQSPLGMLGAVKAPQAAAPIMNAGVSGAQKAPELKAAGNPGAQLQQAIMQMLMNRQGPQVNVPDLGSLIKGAGI